MHREAGQVLPDGGQTQPNPEDEDEDDESEETEGPDEDEVERAEDVGNEAVDESSEDEEANADETEAGESEALEQDEESAPESEAAAEGNEGDGDEDEEEAADHVEDAEEVYTGDDASTVLHLDLDGLFLDLLGLEVNLNPVTLDVSARPGENKLLGNLLSAVTGLLDGSKALSDKLHSLVDKPKQALRSLLSKPRALLGRLFGGGAEPESEEEVEEEADEDEEAESAGEGPTAEETASEGRLSSVTSRAKQTAIGLVPGLPIEELVAAIVREVIQTLIEQMEPDTDESSPQSEGASQTEA